MEKVSYLEESDNSEKNWGKMNANNKYGGKWRKLIRQKRVR